MPRRKKPLVDSPAPIVKAKPGEKKARKKSTKRIRQPIQEKVAIILEVLNDLDKERKRAITLDVIEMFLEACGSGLSTTNAALCCSLNKMATEKLISLIPDFEGEVQRRRVDKASLVTTAMFDKARSGDVAAAKLYLSWHRRALPELQQVTEIELKTPDSLAVELMDHIRRANTSVPVKVGDGAVKPVNRLVGEMRAEDLVSN